MYLFWSRLFQVDIGNDQCEVASVGGKKKQTKKLGFAAIYLVFRSPLIFSDHFFYVAVHHVL